MTDTVDKVIIQSETQGVQQSTDQLNQLGKSMDGVTVASQNIEKSTTSIEGKFSALERRFGTTAGQASQFEKIQRTINTAVAQNPALQDRANAVLEAAAAKYTASGSAAKGAASEIGHLDEIGGYLEARMAGLGAGMGFFGQALQAIGPVGAAVAVGIGAVAVALNYVSEQANKFGESSIEIKNFADATGLTTSEVRGLSEAAEKAGISGDQIATSFERFTANLSSAKDGTGTLFNALAKVDGQLAVDIANARSGAAAWDILAKAIKSTSDVSARAEIAQAALGRGGVANVPVLITTDQAGGIKAYSDELQKATGITDNLTNHTAQLKAEIDATKKLTANVYASIYSDEVLARQAKFAQTELQIAQSIKAATVSASKYGGPSADEFGTPFDFTLLNANRAAADKGAGGSSNAADVEQTKAASAAKAELTEKTSALTAAEKAYSDALDLNARQEGAAILSAKDMADANKSAGDALAVLAAVEKQQISDLNGAATGQEILKQKTDALTASMMQGKISAEDYNRALHGDTNNQVAALQDQRAVIEAVGGAEKMAAQYAADYNAQLRAGKDPADALAIASEKLANAQAQANAAAQQQTRSLQNNLPVAEAVGGAARMSAQYGADYANAMDAGATSTNAAALASAKLATTQAQINSGALETLFNLKNQLQVSQAVTGEEAIQAQHRATYNRLVHEGVDASIASSVAAAEEADARAKATSAVLQQVHALEQSTEMIVAQANGMGPVVAAAQAYENAMRSGASSSAAAALSAATLTNELTKAAIAADKIATDAANAPAIASQAADIARRTRSNFEPVTMPTGSLSFYADPNHPVSYRGGGTGRNLDLGVGGSHGILTVQALDDAYKSRATEEQDAKDAMDAMRKSTSDAMGAMAKSTQSAMAAMQASAEATMNAIADVTFNPSTGPNAGQIDADKIAVAYLQSQPGSVANTFAIASLTAEIRKLSQSTDSLNSTNQDLLSPYYTQDPRTSHIGFRSQGMASGGEFTVPGGYSSNDNMIGTIPLASGEIVSVRRPGENSAGSPQNITINLGGITVNGGAGTNPNAIGRTVYQALQTGAKQIAAAGGR